jgi:type II secretory pathway pseudopilin PulG
MADFVTDTTEGVTEPAQPAPANGVPATWEDVFKHPRFKELQRTAKEAQAALEAQKQAQADAEQAKLKEQEDWKRLFETTEAAAAKLKAELDATHAAMTKREKQLAIQDAARSHEPPFIAEAIGDVLLLIQVDELPDGDELPKAAAQHVKALATSKPWLLQTARTDPGSPPGRKPAGSAGKPTGTGKPMGL